MTGSARHKGHQVIVEERFTWAEFISRHWDRQAVLYKSVQPTPFDENEVFQAALRATEAPDPHLIPPHAQFAVGRFQQTAPESWLPRASDRTFTGYGRRLATTDAQVRSDGYALMVHAFHTFHAAQWERERSFFAGLWEHVGLPTTGAITTLFHGTYEHTPVGVHKDRFATFLFAVQGRKRMRFWTRRPWTHAATTVLDYEPYLQDSFSAEVEPGDLLYWPASHYHVGESVGKSMATSVNVGVPRENHRAVYDLDDLLVEHDARSLMDPDAALARLPAVPASLSVPDAATPGLPAALDQALSAFGTYTETARMRDRAVVQSLRTWTAGGLRPTPPPEEPRTLRDETLVRAVTPVLWGETEDARVCATNGHAVTTALDARCVTRMLDLLSGPGVPVGELLGRLTDGPAAQSAADALPANRTGARRLLEVLESFRGVGRVWAPNE
ncbi:cupin domain-containing protein [Streptomyces sp. ASQP_92]|uniref:cupin domain-containing protein n=1 Tax=Streptomyces sp. ASQP_92 TaxID=2979116 RepID=UPI0021BFFD94|nr:cupin domain-containing protein [Streptomyces sp. ASQP_92]MCT9089853.1 cupin domain-containing protein [Streptomyces sp. ASQP_92]